MAGGPWEKYAKPAPQGPGPWTKYAAPAPVTPQPKAGETIFDNATGAPIMARPPRADAPPTPPGIVGQIEGMLGVSQPATPEQGWPEWLSGLASNLGDGAREGVSTVLGAPVDLLNNAPKLANLLPGVDGVGPITDSPVGGHATVDEILRLGGLIPNVEPQTAGQRIMNRVGQEIGATAVPVAGALGKAASLESRVVNQMVAAPKSIGEGVAGMFLQPAAVNPVGLAGREGAYAAAAGAGAGIANEVAGVGGYNGPGSDFIGSLLGALGLSTASGMGGALKNVVAAAIGAPGMADDVAKSAVASQLINNSSRMQAQYKATGSLDTQPLADSLRVPAPVGKRHPRLPREHRRSGARSRPDDLCLQPGRP